MTVAEMVKVAFRLVTGDSNPDASEQNDMMEALNLMLQEWATSPAGLYQVTRESFSISAGVGSYTIGSNQTFDTALPQRIVRAFVRDSSTDYPVRIIAAEDYARLALKSTESRPYDLYFERGGSSGTVLLYPVPDQSYTLHLYSHKPLGSYTSLSESLGLPPEYEPAIKYNLAMEIAPEFGASLSQIIAVRAGQTLKSLKRLHAQPVPRVNTAIFGQQGRDYDIDGDTYYRS